MSTFTEKYPQAFRPELVCCEVCCCISNNPEVGRTVIKGSGAGSTVEIARANAYHNLASLMFSHFTK